MCYLACASLVLFIPDFSLETKDLSHIRPVQVIIELATDHNRAFSDATMPFVDDRSHVAVFREGCTLLEMAGFIHKQLLDSPFGASLITLHCPDVISPSLNDLGRSLPLSMHGIPDHNGSAQV